MKKDINYTELDHAVSQAMDFKKPRKKKPAPTPIPPQETHEEPATIPNPKPRGRYLDMKNPKSDMRGISKPKPAPKEKIRSTHFGEISTSEDITVTFIKKKPVPPPVSQSERRIAREVRANRDFMSEPRPLSPKQMAERPLQARRPQPAPQYAPQQPRTIQRPSTPKPQQALAERPQNRPQPRPAPKQAPAQENYSLGNRSPFLENAVVEKRPLGEHLPSGAPRAVESTKNVYSQRSITNRPRVEELLTHEVVPPPKRHAGLSRFFLVLLVITIGALVGALIWFLVSSDAEFKAIQ